MLRFLVASVVSNSLWLHVAHQAPLSMGFSRQEYWSGWPCPPPEDLPDPGIEPTYPASPALQAGDTREALALTIDRQNLEPTQNHSYPLFASWPEEGLPFANCEKTLSIPVSREFLLGHAVQHVGSLFPNQGWNLCPLHWELAVLTTGPPEKSFLAFS